jgi:hypothetical protein
LLQGLAFGCCGCCVGLEHFRFVEEMAMSRELLIWWLALSLVAVFNMYSLDAVGQASGCVWCKIAW